MASGLTEAIGFDNKQRQDRPRWHQIRWRRSRQTQPAPCANAATSLAFLELHIEQGGILDAEKINIGVVEGIVGISISGK